jgi:hypothetical protein
LLTKQTTLLQLPHLAHKEVLVQQEQQVLQVQLVQEQQVLLEPQDQQVLLELQDPLGQLEQQV